MKKGFTLIELLVVVLIIGILSAVALPQYQKAVLKSRSTQLFVTMKALRTAQAEYYLANGEYTADPGNLSLDILTDEDLNINCVLDSGGKFYCQVRDRKIPDLFLEYVFNWYSPDGSFRCGASSQNAKGVCISYGGVLYKTSEGGGTTFYKLAVFE